MVNNTNLPFRALTRIACTFFALLFGVLLISAFTLVNCAMGEDEYHDLRETLLAQGSKVSWSNSNDDPIDVQYVSQKFFNLTGCGNWISSFELNEKSGSYRFTVLEDVYQLSACTELHIHPRSDLAFESNNLILTNSIINVQDLYIVVDGSDTTYHGYSNGSSITFDTCYSEALNIDVGIMGSDKAITIAGNDLKTNEINLVSGNVIFASDTTFNVLDSNSGIKLTSTSNTDVKITAQGLTFNAPLTLSSENAALKICCEAGGLVCQESVFISSGRIDIKGAMDASLSIGNDAQFSPEFSPGNSVGNVVVNGDFELLNNAFLVIEEDGTGIDSLKVNNFIAPNETGEEKWLKLDITAIAPAPEYVVIEVINGLTDSQTDPQYWLNHLEGELPFYMTLSVEGNTVKLSIDHNAVPEPSTWALLILGASGLLYIRKREKNA